MITVANLRGQDVANRVIPGVGHLISAFIVLGGIAFNIGNIGGAGLAMNVIFGIPPIIGSLIAAVLIIGIFLLRNAKGVMDSVMQVLGLVMLCMIGYAMLQSSPPLMEAVSRSFNPDDPLILLLPIVTLVGGTVGGYISFSGGHRLVEAGITGVENVRLVTRAAVIGIATTGVVRICLFLAALGVVSQGLSLDPSNPAASVFSHSMGTIGYKIFGVVLLAASVSSVIGAAYTSVTFMYSLHDSIRRHNQRVVIAFIACSTLIYSLVGQPVKVLVVAGTLNALVLPLALALHIARIAQNEHRWRRLPSPHLDAGVRHIGHAGHGGRGGDVVQCAAGVLASVTGTAGALSARRATNPTSLRTGHAHR